ncbi:TPA: energy-coupling factor transporter transmembrane protein EcfT [Streptococcus agalactiae]|nr:energy-coupling factor transporter transmembrane protein EcfT [Streptococcus agalactiae]HEN9093650.1 energy-coupling factor transporter transmembrane protein EcfT [Streptococcus agalactiae]
MGVIPNGVIKLDDRTKMILLLSTSICVFSTGKYIVITAFIVILMLLSFLLGISDKTFKAVLNYAFVSIIEYKLFPIMPEVLVVNFNILIVTVIKLTPCYLAAQILIQTTSIRMLMQALEKIKFPKALIIALVISMRYFPALKEERHHISDALKLRNIKGIKRIKFALMPLMVSASNTAEELSQAIIARGIDNPAKRTYEIQSSIQVIDVFVIGASFSAVLYLLIRNVL